MRIYCIAVDFATVRADVVRHLTTLSSWIDSYLEMHILESNHYRIMIDDEWAGIASVHKEHTVTQCIVFDAYKRHGQSIFRAVKRLESVNAAFVPTFDEWYLTHALDDYRSLRPFAYAFRYTGNAILPIDTHYAVRDATTDDQTLIIQHTNDFFGDVAHHIRQQGLFVVEHDAQCVGFGIRERSMLYDAVASIGMYVLETCRNQGVGTHIIKYLINHCLEQSIHPIAGCWYYNHNSKKTLERAGLVTTTRFLKFEF